MVEYGASDCIMTAIGIENLIEDDGAVKTTDWVMLGSSGVSIRILDLSGGSPLGSHKNEPSPDSQPILCQYSKSVRVIEND